MSLEKKENDKLADVIGHGRFGKKPDSFDKPQLSPDMEEAKQELEEATLIKDRIIAEIAATDLARATLKGKMIVNRVSLHDVNADIENERELFELEDKLKESRFNLIEINARVKEATRRWQELMKQLDENDT